MADLPDRRTESAPVGEVLSRLESRAGARAEPVRATPRRVEVLWMVALALAAALLSVLAVVNGSELSDLDEPTHLDYTWKISQGELPYAGVPLSNFTLEELACRGQASANELLPSCAQTRAGEFDPTAFPVGGENYNAWHPPLYYALTALAGMAGEALGISFTVGARLSGSVWLMAAVVALYALLRHWRVPPALSAAGASLLLSAPSTVHASATVTNDAPAALFGVGAVWVLTRVFRDGRTGWYAWVLPTVLALVTAGTKLMNSLAILVVVGLVGLSALRYVRDRNWSEAMRRLLIAAGPVLAIALVAVAWSAFQDGRGVPDWENPLAGISTHPVEGAPVDEWAPTLPASFGIVTSYFLQGSLMSPYIEFLVGALGVLLTAAPLLALAVFGRKDPEQLIGWAALIGVLATPLLVQGQEFLRHGTYFSTLTPRYSVTLLPMTIAALTLVVDERGVHVAAYVLAVGGYLIMLLSFVGVL